MASPRNIHKYLINKLVFRSTGYEELLQVSMFKGIHQSVGIALQVGLGQKSCVVFGQ